MKQKDIDSQITELKSKMDQLNATMAQQKLEHDKTIQAYVKEKLDSDVKIGQLKAQLAQQSNQTTNDAQTKKTKAKANNDQIIEDFINENEKHNYNESNRTRSKPKTTPFIYNWEIIDEITSEEANIHRKTSFEIDQISTLAGKLKKSAGNKKDQGKQIYSKLQVNDNSKPVNDINKLEFINDKLINSDDEEIMSKNNTNISKKSSLNLKEKDSKVMDQGQLEQSNEDLNLKTK